MRTLQSITVIGRKISIPISRTVVICEFTADKGDNKINRNEIAFGLYLPIGRKEVNVNRIRDQPQIKEIPEQAC